MREPNTAVRSPYPYAAAVVVLGAAISGPAGFHAALAAAAGTLFEATPFVLAAAVVPPRLRAVVPLAGCGCAGRLPGALSLPATALCWIAFGPAIALARLAVATLIVAWPSMSRIADRHEHRGTAANRERGTRAIETDAIAGDDVFATLIRLAGAAALAALVAGALPGWSAALGSGVAGTVASIALGAALGVLAPCATAALAVAAALARHAPAATAGILATTGLVAIPRASYIVVRIGSRFRVAGPDVTPGRAGIRLAYVAIALCLATVAHGGAAGFVNPRLLPVVAIGCALAVVAAARAGTGGTTTSALLVPAVMLIALVSGSPVPAYTANATDLDAAFAGERLTFTGVAHRRAAATVLERFAIACCRADASPVAVRLDDALAVADGAWIEATGTLVVSGGGLVLRPATWRRIASPRDPFLYR